jgi:sec-independent protein translocase protein TatA
MLPASMLPLAFLPNIGWPEAMLIFGVVIIFFGPQKLPEIAEALGKSIRKFKAATRELQNDVQSEVQEARRIDPGKASPPAPPSPPGPPGPPNPPNP